MTNLLAKALRTLSPPRRAAVVEAHAAWLASGLKEFRADALALHYAQRLQRAAKDAIQRTNLNATARAAARHEPEFQRIFLDAVKKAQQAVPLQALETALASREVPWDLLEPVVATLERELNG